jgi:hypothetical protein
VVLEALLGGKLKAANICKEDPQALWPVAEGLLFSLLG